MSTPSTCCAVLLICAAPLGAIAQDSEPDGFWGSLDLGGSSVSTAHSYSGSYSSGATAMNFRGGYHWGPKFYAALELGGLNFEATDPGYNRNYNGDPTKGVGIQQTMLALRYYPDSDRPWFLHGGVGKANYWTNHIGESGGTGNAFELGAGWDIQVQAIGRNFYLTPSLMLSTGDISSVTSPPGITQNLRYRSVSLMIGMTIR